MPINPDVAVLYPDIAAHGSMAARLRAETAGRLAEESVASEDADPCARAWRTRSLGAIATLPS
jgi:hypothetical protein